MSNNNVSDGVVGADGAGGTNGDLKMVRIQVPEPEADGDRSTDYLLDEEPPQRIQMHEIFTELDVLFMDEERWVEQGRWIKYEQCVEPAADRWGKPHISSLSFHSLVSLKTLIEHGTVLLDVEQEVIPAIMTRIIDQLVKDNQLVQSQIGIVKWALQLKHRYMRPGSSLHKFTAGRKVIRTSRPPHKKKTRKISTVNRDQGDESDESPTRKVSVGQKDPTGKLLKINTPEQSARAQGRWGLVRQNLHKITGRPKSGLDFSNLVSDLIELNEAEKFMQCIAPGSEIGSIMVGAADFLDHPFAAFVRLSEGRLMGLNLTEVPLPVRFIFVYMVPENYDSDVDPLEVGRAMGTLLSSPKFRPCAYTAMDRQDLLAGVHTFMTDSLVLPTGQQWEEETVLPILQRIIRREKDQREAQAMRKKSRALSTVDASRAMIINQENIKVDRNPLIRTRRPFGGLIEEAKGRYPQYWSDIKDGLNSQCLGAIFFIYFAALSPAVTFGGLLSEKTDKWIGVTETLIMSSIAGMLFAFLSAQPLVILGVTGPLLVFEESLFQVCAAFDLEYLSFHFWVGIWLAIIITLVVAFEGTCLVRYVSRFTQEIFALLISLIFIFESFKKLYIVFKKHPLDEYYPYPTEAPNVTINSNGTGTGNSTAIPKEEDISIWGKPNTALLSLILCLGTYYLASFFAVFKTGHIFGKTCRKMIGNFSIPIAILIMVLIDFLIKDTYTEKLDVPDGVKPTDAEKRGWFVNPMGMEKKLPIWAIFMAIVPAIIALILIYMEAQITSLIVNKNLQKGSGYHLDFNLIGLFAIISGILGLPLVCAATVRSVTHVNALCVYSKTYAPGEKPTLEYVMEQRITAIFVHILIGVSILLGPALREVATAVLFGVFLYMGIASLRNIEFWDRIILLLTPVKHHPDLDYVRKVRTSKMHMFTAIQLMILAALWAIKSTRASLGFPFLLILCVPIRMVLLPIIFDKKELQWLDKDENTVIAEEEEEEW